MSKLRGEDKIFEEVLNHSEDISEAYNDGARLRDKLTDPPEYFLGFLSKIRDKMEGSSRIRRIESIQSSVVSKIELFHKTGLISAVDGTDAIAPIEVSSKTVYAAGVISTTSRTLHEPSVTLTASHRVIPTINSDDDFLRFVDKLDSFVKNDQSWVRSFREYCERKEALRILCDNPSMELVLIDGPLYTQNLLSQTSARNGILNEMLGQPTRMIGYIKNMQSSKIMHLAGMALKPGEYWTLGTWRQVLVDRFKDHPASEWIGKSENEWVRTVYRKTNKSFSFECHPGLVEKGIALVHSKVCCSNIVNHEIPFLLHAADTIIQARMDAKAKSDNLINSSPFYANLANERAFR